MLRSESGVRGVHRATHRIQITMAGVELNAQEQLTLSVVNDATRSFGISMNAFHFVCNIAPDGLAHEAGVRVGDKLLTFNEKPVNNEDNLFEAMRQIGNGDSVTFVLERKEGAPSPPPRTKAEEGVVIHVSAA